ncbi:hypothetical protein KSX_26120 [Ktedonospora formicarum]|uniref:Uncharacterized protein n=1 Tax=Ktedonospora formicarum TaxID=2778364 RepID=A0A8J3I2U6_9CHLR|nr:hypothetical protein KSX_26120 [Ktedonospora formicarum]
MCSSFLSVAKSCGAPLFVECHEIVQPTYQVSPQRAHATHTPIVGLCGFSHTFEEHIQELEALRNQMQEYNDDFEDAM